MKDKKQSPSKTSGKTANELNKALRHVEDMMERAICPFLLLDETLKSVCLIGHLEGDRLVVGVLKKHLTPEVISVFESPDLSIKLDNYKRSDDKLEYQVDSVPVVIKIIHNTYGCFKNPNTLVFNYGDYLIPNPLEDYWKIAGLIE